MISSDIIRKHFRRISARKVYELEANINSVIDSDGKPAYLVDAVSTKQDQLELLIKELNNDRDGYVSLVLIIIDDEDFLIGNRRKIIKALIDCLEDRVILVDISKDLPNTSKIVKCSELPNIVEMIGSVKNSLEILDDSSILMNVQMRCSWNGTTLFGALLGYPFIYYYDNDSNNLSFVELAQIEAKKNSQTIYSFTVPRHILDENVNLQSYKEEWIHSVSSKGFEIEEKCVTLQSVAM